MKIALINFYVQVFFLINVNFSHENIFNLLTLYKANKITIKVLNQNICYYVLLRVLQKFNSLRLKIVSKCLMRFLNKINF